MPALRLDPLTRADVPAVADFWQDPASARFIDAGPRERTLAYLYEMHPNAIGLVARERPSGPPVAFMDSTHLRARTFQLGLLVVSPQHRGRGVGRAALAALEGYARERGAERRIYAFGVDTENVTSQRLFRAAGWMECAPEFDGDEYEYLLPLIAWER